MDAIKNFPTEVIELPSKGLVYSESNPLSSGKVEMKYMTAKEEDILTNQSYIQKGIVLDKLLQALIVSKIDYNDLIIGDKNAIMVAARVLGYGKDYSFEYNGSDYTVDLSKIDNKPFEIQNKGVNEFNYTLPSTNTNITYKILTHGDEQKITIREFVDNYLLARDSRELRKHIRDTQPDVDLTFFPDGSENRIDIPVGVKFFWPDF